MIEPVLNFQLICELSELDGNLYFEFLPGIWDEMFWHKEAVYIGREEFGYLRHVFARHIPEFDHHLFIDVPRGQWASLLQHLNQLVEQLGHATKLEDIRSELEFVFEHSEERFTTNFTHNTCALAAMTRELITWLSEQLRTHDGVAILGV